MRIKKIVDTLMSDGQIVVIKNEKYAGYPPPQQRLLSELPELQYEIDGYPNGKSDVTSENNANLL
jgi:hypothetical protein